MELKKKIRVLIVDDSAVFRAVLAKGIASDANIEVVATANDPFDARDKIIEYEPDVMTCDVEMPKMNGIEFIRRLLPQYSLPVIVASTVSGAVFDAMDAGAVDFVAKPDVASAQGVQDFIRDMIYKIKVASAASVRQRGRETVSEELCGKHIAGSRKIIAIGASTGGTEAIFNVLKGLPETTPGIVIVQHIPPVFSRMFAERLDKSLGLCVKEAANGDYVERGKVLIAPGDRHMRIKRAGDRYRVECYEGEKVNGHCPSVDILFESMAKEAGEHAVGVILTGMGYDGAKGLLAMRQKGARTIGQDEGSSVVYGMPRVAFNIGAVEKQASLEKIAPAIYAMLK